MLATPSGVSGAVSSVDPYWWAVSGHRVFSFERLVPLVDYFAAWKLLPNVSQWVLHTVERGYPVRFLSASIQQGELHSGGPRAGSGNGTRSRYSLKEGSHRGGSSSQKGVRVHSSKEGWRFASHFRLAATEPFSQQTEVQDAHNQTGRDSNQV